TQVGKDIMKLFVDLNAEAGITVIIITHDPKIAKQCNRSVRMQDGVIIDD
ncbi:MAG: macrolide ABC transporter ATP-binding protein, partial [Deltaproteobacteria bacterium]|nr:macrolide ABC transporter ATP-binding protein [Deltaproteobacteria bacterium]